jgi:hypothetical protein
LAVVAGKLEGLEREGEAPGGWVVEDLGAVGRLGDVVGRPESGKLGAGGGQVVDEGGQLRVGGVLR